jgi:hypothetical protein
MINNIMPISKKSSKKTVVGSIASPTTSTDHALSKQGKGTRHIGLVRLSYKPYFFSQQTVFFSHSKSANSTFSHGQPTTPAAQSCALDCTPRCFNLQHLAYYIH